MYIYSDGLYREECEELLLNYVANYKNYEYLTF